MKKKQINKFQFLWRCFCLCERVNELRVLNSFSSIEKCVHTDCRFVMALVRFVVSSLFFFFLAFLKMKSGIASWDNAWDTQWNNSKWNIFTHFLYQIRMVNWRESMFFFLFFVFSTPIFSSIFSHFWPFFTHIC